MRRFLTVSVLAALAATPALATAQDATSHGSIIIGGSAGFTSSKSETGNTTSPSTTSIFIRPNVLYFVIDGLAVGGDLSYSHRSSNGQSSASYGVGPAARYFFGSRERMWYPFVGASVGFGHDTSDNASDSDSSLWQVGGGMLFLLSRSVGLTTELFYSTLHRSRDLPVGPGPGTSVDVDDHTFGLAVGIAAFVF